MFATYAESDEQLRHVIYLAESIREFAGRFSEASILLYLPDGYTQRDSDLLDKLHQLNVAIRGCTIPEQTSWYYFAGKTHASGLAETEAIGAADILVWLDEDTIILREPTDLLLADSIGLGYRPVMHNRSGTLWGEPPTPFWAQIYEVLEIEPDSLFPMLTVADRQQIRAYFNAGLLAVRPERGLLRGWDESFVQLCDDKTLSRMCLDNVERRIFLHQTALVGAVCHRLSRQQMIELPASYNYPIFFKQQYGGLEEFDDISEVVTLRYDIYFRNPDPAWAEKLRGPAEQIAWLKSRLGAK